MEDRAVSLKAVMEILNHQRFGIQDISWGILTEKLTELPPAECDYRCASFESRKQQRAVTEKMDALLMPLVQYLDEKTRVEVRTALRVLKETPVVPQDGQ
jgi:hypothetical protein